MAAYVCPRIDLDCSLLFPTTGDLDWHLRSEHFARRIGLFSQSLHPLRLGEGQRRSGPRLQAPPGFVRRPVGVAAPVERAAPARPRPPAEAGGLPLMHRAGAAAFGLALWAFGIAGFVHHLAVFSTRGEHVLGMSSNGLLSLVSMVVGGVLLSAALRGGRISSTVAFTVGIAFVLSGLVGLLTLHTAFNVLAFGLANVAFSLLAGAALLVLGAYGRFTGGLHADNPYIAR